MKDKNRKLAADVLSALYAEDKLDEVIEFIRRSDDTIKKTDSLKILERRDDFT